MGLEHFEGGRPNNSPRLTGLQPTMFDGLTVLAAEAIGKAAEKAKPIIGQVLHKAGSLAMQTVNWIMDATDIETYDEFRNNLKKDGGISKDGS